MNERAGTRLAVKDTGERRLLAGLNYRSRRAA
jgi:hypothetical protein